MNINDAAKLAESTYIMGGKGKSRQSKYDEINDFVKNTGYSVVPKHTNKNIITFKNNEGDIHISQQGTNIRSTTAFKDISND